ncbi:MAG: tyrosine-type recombinase/integrase [Oryzihumus sp.]
MASPAFLTRVTVRDAVLQYQESLERRVMRSEMSPTSLHAYTRDLAEFVALLGPDTVLDDVEGDDIEVALTRLAKAPDRRFTKGVKMGQDGSQPQGRGPHARARWFTAVRGLFRWATDRGYVQVDPTLKLSPPRTPKRASGARLGLQAGEARTLRAAPSTKAVDHPRANQGLTLRDEAILRLLIESGPRVSELCGANRTDIRMHEETDRPVLRVHGKGGKDRDLPLTRRTVEAINAYLEQGRPSPPPVTDPADTARSTRVADAERALFVTVRGWRMAPRDVQYLIQRYTRAKLDRRATPHALRHTALTILARSGVDIATVAQIAGHANLSTTSIYMDESMSAAADAVDHSPMADD